MGILLPQLRLQSLHNRHLERRPLSRQRAPLPLRLRDRRVSRTSVLRAREVQQVLPSKIPHPVAIREFPNSLTPLQSAFGAKSIAQAMARPYNPEEQEERSH